MTEDTQELTRAIRGAMARLGLNQEELAARAKLSAATLSRLLTGKRTHVTAKTRAKLTPLLDAHAPSGDVIMLPHGVYRNARVTFAGQVDLDVEPGYRVLDRSFPAASGKLCLVRTPDGRAVECRLWHRAVAVPCDDLPADEQCSG